MLSVFLAVGATQGLLFFSVQGVSAWKEMNAGTELPQKVVVYNAGAANGFPHGGCVNGLYRFDL